MKLKRPNISVWTPERDALLRELYSNGMVKDFAATLGCSVGSVRNRLWRLGICKKRFWSTDEDDILRSMYPHFKRGDGSMDKLMKNLGRDRTSIESRVDILGIGNPNRPISLRRREEISSSALARLKSKPASIHSKSVKGKRSDIGGTYFRSAWEANYARFLTFSGVKWEYENKTFWFEKIKRGTRFYTPDFFLPATNEFHEVKGWMDQKSRTKLKRMAKYYPDVKVVIISREWFAAANRQGLCSVIPGWECQHKRHNRVAERPSRHSKEVV